MRCRVQDLRCKEVINVCDGRRLGCVCDVIINTANGQLLAIVVPGPCRFFIFMREDDFVIPWECIRKISDEVILIEVPGEHRRERRPPRKWMI